MSRERIIIFGASEAGLDALNRTAIIGEREVLFIVDNNPEKQGLFFHDHEIKHPKHIKNYIFDKVLIASIYKNEIFYQLTNHLNISKEKIEIHSLPNDFSDKKFISAILNSNQRTNKSDLLLDKNLKKTSKKVINSVLEDLEESHPPPFEYFLYLYYWLCDAGHFDLAYRAKSLAQSSEISNKDCYSENDIVNRYISFVEQFRFDKAEQLLTNHQEKLDSVRCYNFLGNARWLNGEDNIANKMWEKAKKLREQKDNCSGLLLNDSSEVKFEAIIRDKTIAIIGSAQSNEKTGAEIDEHDVVIRINSPWKQPLNQIDPIYGNKTTVSYVSNPCYFDNFEKFKKIVTLANDTSVFLCAPLTAQKFISSHCPNLPVRTFERYPCIYRGNSFMVTAILIDLFKYQPQSIKIFKSDFYSGSQSHRKNYLNYPDFKKLIILDDPVRNHEFARKAYRLPNVGCDKMLNTILNLSRAEYIQRLNNCLSHKGDLI